MYSSCFVDLLGDMGDIDSSSSEPECLGMEGAATAARHVAPAKSLVGLVCKGIMTMMVVMM